MSETPRYVLNENEGAADVLHVNPREECNLDDAESLKELDPATAQALVARGLAERCIHCNSEEEPVT